MLRKNLSRCQCWSALDHLAGFCKNLAPPFGKPAYWTEAMNEHFTWFCRPKARQRLLTIALAAAGLVFGLGGLAEETKPQTVTEWMQQPRVGELRPK